MGKVSTADREPRNGTFPNGMDYLSRGSGPKTLLFIQGGPGSTVPQGMLRRIFRRQFDAFLHAGYAVWVVTRRRGMPPEHRIADMADDYAGLIAEEFGGRVDVVVGESFGGQGPSPGGLERPHARALSAEGAGSARGRRNVPATPLRSGDFAGLTRRTAAQRGRRAACSRARTA